MKWLPPQGSTQGTADERYVIVQANSKDWIAYALTPFATSDELAVKPSAAEAREVCEDHEREMVAMRRAG